MATVAELRTRATELGLSVPSKIRKADLEALIAGHASNAPKPLSKAEAARIAGSKGKSAEPMGNENRVRVYASQRGAHWLELQDGERCERLNTPRQARRIRHKGNRAKGKVPA